MDKIVYVVWTAGGGIDGLDKNDKPKPRFATYNKLEAQNIVGPWDRKDVEALVVDVEQSKKEALAKLSPVDRLMLGV